MSKKHQSLAKKDRLKATQTKKKPKKQIKPKKTMVVNQPSAIVVNGLKKDSITAQTGYSLSSVKKRLLFLGLALVLVFSIFISYLFFFVRQKLISYQPVNFSVDFINPQQAVVFFKTARPSYIYLKTGKDKHHLNQVYMPSSTQKTNTHIVEIGQVPAKGVWLKPQIKNESFLINWLMTTQFIKYAPKDEESL